MPRRCRVDAAAVTTLGELDVVAVADLAALGVPRSTVYRRVRERKDRRLLRGVVKLGRDDPTPDQRAVAALLYGGSGSVISGAEAARRYGLERVPANERILVLVRDDRQRTSTEFVTVERTETLPTGVVRGGILLAPLERAVCDAARHIEREDDVRALVAEAVQRGFTTAERLRAELDAGNQRWSSLPRRVLDEVAVGARSTAESWALELHRGASLPPILWNPRLYLPDGRYLGCPDGYFADVGLAWQIDSLAFHLSPDDWDKTLRARTRLTGAGLIVEHTRPRRLKAERSAVVAELRAALDLAASRPTPDIRVVPPAAA